MGITGRRGVRGWGDTLLIWYAPKKTVPNGKLGARPDLVHPLGWERPYQECRGLRWRRRGVSAKSGWIGRGERRPGVVRRLHLRFWRRVGKCRFIHLYTPQVRNWEWCRGSIAWSDKGQTPPWGDLTIWGSPPPPRPCSVDWYRRPFPWLRRYGCQQKNRSISILKM